MSPALSYRVNIAYFGKIKTRGDFVRNNVHAQLMSNLDDWVARAVEQLRVDPHWQVLYDSLSPLKFLLLGTQRKLAVGGYLTTGQDSSGRRFPFFCATPVEATTAEELVVYAPLMFRPVWEEMEDAVTRLVASHEPTEELTKMDSLSAEIYPSAGDSFASFLDSYTLYHLAHGFAAAGHNVNLHNLVLALGELLVPLMNSNKNYAERGLLLPMPRSSVGAYQVASFWLSLIAPFLLNNDFELTLYYGNIGGKPRLAVGLLGADSHELASLMSTPNAIAERFINLDEALWVDQLIANNSEKAKLSSYLRQDRLSLRTLYNTFRQIYLNESQ